MNCNCQNRQMQSELCRISGLARKAAILDECIYAVYLRNDGTYAFDKVGQEIIGKIVEFRHYL